MDDESHVEDKFMDKDMLKDVQVADPELMLEEELVAGDDMMKMEDLPPSGEPSYFAGFGRARIYGRPRRVFLFQILMTRRVGLRWLHFCILMYMKMTPRGLAT